MKLSHKIIVFSDFFTQGEVETQGTFDEVSKTKLFEELLQEEELEDEAGNRGQLLRQRTMSIQSHSSVSTTMDNTVEELEKEAEETTELMEKGNITLIKISFNP
ncbi:unnamed protein product [Euphydryas editha]|uniref:Uncharacterized protein n=1 Tax=Euphydryas editha TaxID=104508 RepID=A0AAU9UP77_EUPED|nr:unnamed protein product [Euphydryas editha]